MEVDTAFGRQMAIYSDQHGEALDVVEESYTLSSPCPEIARVLPPYDAHEEEAGGLGSHGRGDGGVNEEVCDIQHRDKEPLLPGHQADNHPPSSIPLLSVKTLMLAGWNEVVSSLKSCGDPLA